MTFVDANMGGSDIESTYRQTVSIRQLRPYHDTSTSSNYMHILVLEQIRYDEIDRSPVPDRLL
jgi:hypothetical protein